MNDERKSLISPCTPPTMGIEPTTQAEFQCNGVPTLIMYTYQSYGMYILAKRLLIGRS